jgi:hypothetical protein
MAADEEARVLIGDRERVAVASIRGAELALEVGGPKVVGLARARGDDARVRGRAPGATPVHEPTPREEIGRGAGRGPVRHARVPVPQDAQQLARAPLRVRRAEGAQQLGKVRRDRVRRVVRRAAPVGEATPALLGVAVHPLVAYAAAHAVAGAELRHGEAVTLSIGHELQALVHRGRLRPGHRHLAHSRDAMQFRGSVTYVPGLMCYRCPRAVPPAT